MVLTIPADNWYLGEQISKWQNIYSIDSVHKQNNTLQTIVVVNFTNVLP